MQIISLNEQQFDLFSKTHMYRNYYQTSSYGNTMKQNNYKIEYIGIEDNGNLVGASLLIYRKIVMNKSIAYAPRGPLFDYRNKEKFIEFSNALKEYLNKKNVIFIRIDPYIPATVRDKNGTVINMNNDINNIMVNIKSGGWIYKGQNKYFENELPRYEGIILLNKNINSIYKDFSKTIKHKINRASNCGITIFKDEKKNIDILYELCKNKTNLSKKFIQSFINNFSTSSVYNALLNTDSFVIEAKRHYEKEIERNNYLTKKIQFNSSKKNLNLKMESDKLINIYKADLVLATELLKKYPEGLIIASALTIEYNNISYLIIDGYNKKFGYLNANYLLKWYIIDDCNDRKLNYFNINALVGEFKKNNRYKNLNEMKLGFNAVPTEYIGEFDLKINNINYLLYKGFSKDKNYKIKKDIH